MGALSLLLGLAAVVAIPWVLRSAFRSPIGPRVDISRLMVSDDLHDDDRGAGVFETIGGVLVGFVGEQRRREMETMIAQAGRPDGWSVERIVGMRVVLCVVLVGLGALRMLARPDVLSVFVMVVGAGVGWVAPPAWWR